VCYDIPENKQRNKVSNVLKGFGTRVQRSIFECDITQTQFNKLRERLGKVIKEEDGVRYYVLCASCVSKIEVVQGAPVTKTQLYFAI